MAIRTGETQLLWGVISFILVIALLFASFSAYSGILGAGRDAVDEYQSCNSGPYALVVGEEGTRCSSSIDCSGLGEGDWKYVKTACPEETPFCCVNLEYRTAEECDPEIRCCSGDDLCFGNRHGAVIENAARFWECVHEGEGSCNMEEVSGNSRYGSCNEESGFCSGKPARCVGQDDEGYYECARQTADTQSPLCARTPILSFDYEGALASGFSDCGG